jgi:hypothetical protein
LPHSALSHGSVPIATSPCLTTYGYEAGRVVLSKED